MHLIDEIQLILGINKRISYNFYAKMFHVEDVFSSKENLSENMENFSLKVITMIFGFIFDKLKPLR